jgi:NACalpha-BTF3-like transcription factor
LTDAADARLLLRQSPDDYVAERTRLVKQARAAGDRETANFYQSLKRPPLSVWAVLAAADDAAAVNEVMAATRELAKVQAGGSNAGALTTATKKRRTSLEALVERAVRALAKTESGAEARRAEIRGMIDQLSRHPELADAWIDGTLRDLPDDALGFTAFADLEVSEAPPRSAAKPVKDPPKGSRGSEAEAKPAADDKPARRAARAADTKQARQDVTTAAREVTVVERRVDAARAEARKAEKALREAEGQLANAQKRHDAARDRLETLRTD